MEATKTTVIREAGPGIPAVVRQTGEKDLYGGYSLLNQNKNKDLDFQPELDLETNKKALMEPKEIEYRQEKNIEELKRIGIFIHTMNSLNKSTEKSLRELELELDSIDKTLLEFTKTVESSKVKQN